MPDIAGAYTQTRTAMADIARSLTDEQRRARVPACPDWTVTELFAHVSSISVGVATGTFPADLNPSAFWDVEMAKRRESFIDESLAARSDASLEEILQEWETNAPVLEAMMRGERAWPDGAPPLSDWVVMTDLAAHHHDLRGAVGMPGDRDSLATGLSLRSYVESMRFRALIEGLPTFRMVAGSRDWVIGTGDPLATVTADPFELARAASGRRNPEQVRAFAWDGDPESFLPYFYPYGMRTDALVE